MNFTKTQIKQIESKGLTVDIILKQLEVFKSGLPYINLEAAAELKNGIHKFSEEEQNNYINYFDTKKDTLDIIKFVPASGAATRMFKFLYEFLETYNPKKETINSYINKHKASKLSLFLVGLEKLPFYNIILNETKKHVLNFESLKADKKVFEIIKTILHEKRLNYGVYPKGLLPFHKYKDHIATAFEEHLFEASLYAKNNTVCNVHFTISEIHKKSFDKEFERIKNIVEQKTNTTFNISFSYQKENTDTIAVNLKNEPFINKDGSFYFRPSGHGALLSNLNDFNTDIIFIKNIDNVVVYKYENEIAQYKKMLAGILLKTQKKAFNYLKELEKEIISEKEIITIAQFLQTELNIKISPEFEKFSPIYQKEYLIQKLNRPIRVCGMVKNEGEPGGGPFWIKNQAGNVSLQIVESAQIDTNNPYQKQILNNATHFNPVDLVCGIKNYKGEVFNLFKYVNSNTAFITHKTKTGKNIKALELPGLWNGSMAHWNTIFVEVPIITFNPVKTVNDLLKPTHQVK